MVLTVGLYAESPPQTTTITQTRFKNRAETIVALLPIGGKESETCGKPPFQRVSAVFEWCQRRDLNPRPKAYESSALPLSYSGTSGLL